MCVLKDTESLEMCLGFWWLWWEGLSWLGLLAWATGMISCFVARTIEI
jgi:hypothetical protein